MGYCHYSNILDSWNILDNIIFKFYFHCYIIEAGILYTCHVLPAVLFQNQSKYGEFNEDESLIFS